MTGTTQAPEVCGRAKRGDVSITQASVRCGSQCGEARSLDSISVGTVASITRDGIAKSWMRAGEHGGRPCKVPSDARTCLLPKDTVCVPAALAMAATHGIRQDSAFAAYYRTLDQVRGDMR